MPYKLTDTWNLKNKIYKQTKQKPTHRYKNKLMVMGWEEGWGLGEKGEEIQKYKF